MHMGKIKTLVKKKKDILVGKFNKCKGKNKSSKQVFISGHCKIYGNLTSFKNNMSDYAYGEYVYNSMIPMTSHTNTHSASIFHKIRCDKTIPHYNKSNLLVIQLF